MPPVQSTGRNRRVIRGSLTIVVVVDAAEVVVDAMLVVEGFVVDVAFVVVVVAGEVVLGWVPAHFPFRHDKVWLLVPLFMRTVEPSYEHSVIGDPLDWLVPPAQSILHSPSPDLQQSTHISPEPERVVVVDAMDDVVVVDKVVVVETIVVDAWTVVVVLARVVVVSSSARQHLFLQQP
jgi:hypothetical protein